MNALALQKEQNISLAFNRTLVCMSWEAPKHKTSVNVQSFEDFERLVLTRFDVTTLAECIDITLTKGVYKGIAENSAIVSFKRNIDSITLTDLLVFSNVLKTIGADLGQESILMRHDNENILIDCMSGNVLASGNGVFYAASDDDSYTILNDIKFAYNLTFNE